MHKKNKSSEYLMRRDRHSQSAIVATPFKKAGALERKHALWSVFIMVFSFVLSILLLLASSSVFSRVSVMWALTVVLCIVLIGVLFDMIGVAVTAAEETPFHSMASRKIRGARRSIAMIRNASRVSSFCNDVVGDICGVVSGIAGASIVFRMFASGNIQLMETLMGAVIAAITVGGKAVGKHFGISNSHYIIFQVGRLLTIFGEGKPVRKPKNGKKHKPAS